MTSGRRTVEQLRREVSGCEARLDELRRELEEAETEVEKRSSHTSSTAWKWPLAEEEYERYGRQLVLPGVGVKGQLNLKSASVLIVGAGGLGCPAALYLAGAGVGTMGVVDGDTVEASNLHRQIAHSSSRIGVSKTESVIASMKELNPLLSYRNHPTHLTPTNAEEIVSQYDVVLDCTDHPTSRYLVSDICVLLQRPLVSASALRTDGQLIVLNCLPAPQGAPGEWGGPCYRCVFPKPPPAESVVSCGEGGVLGPVVGVMGVLQALEAIKIIASGRHHPPAPAHTGASENGAAASAEPSEVVQPPTLVLFSSPLTGPPTFRNVRMRGRRRDCFACSATSTLTLETLRSGSLDYVQFCGGAAAGLLDLLEPGERVSTAAYNRLLAETPGDHLLLDVREREHFELGSIRGAVNVPYSMIQKDARVEANDGGNAKVDKHSLIKAAAPHWIPRDLPPSTPIYVVCRVGHDSQLVVRQLKDLGLAAAEEGQERLIADISGGMRAWKRNVDPTMPFA